MDLDPVRLPQDLIAFDTINPPGRELACIEKLVGILSEAGSQTKIHPFEENRANLISIWGGGPGPSLCFNGHIDTLPLGSAPWRSDMLGGEIVDGRLYGRGSIDMKSGVPALVTATCAAALGELPTVVLEPGEPGMAHQTDEYCFVDHIRVTAKIYTRLIEEWQS